MMNNVYMYKHIYFWQNDFDHLDDNREAIYFEVEKIAACWSLTPDVADMFKLTWN